MDLKSLDYSLFSGIGFEKITASIENIKSAKDYEIRFTMFSEYIKEDDFEKLALIVDGIKQRAPH